ncbi:MAG: cytochrome b [Candidatus Thiodiazotropha sp. (ex Monitilora ramsayi)]|nr:cytochrome b [Candidatus Thiodiazotropha sp. (ex Monitilora ramsayi)]
MLKNTENGYGVIAKGFHWLLFFMLTFSVVAGNFLSSMPKGTEKLQSAGMHKSFGVILLLLILLRFAWKLINTTPRPPEGSTVIENLLAQGMHWALYALMFAQPLSGILMSQTAGYPVSVFGLFELPVLIDKNPSSAELFRNGHGVIWILLAVAVAGHVAAALFHHFIKKDDVLKSITVGTQV